MSVIFPELWLARTLEQLYSNMELWWRSVQQRPSNLCDIILLPQHDSCSQTFARAAIP